MPLTPTQQHVKTILDNYLAARREIDILQDPVGQEPRSPSADLIAERDRLELDLHIALKENGAHSKVEQVAYIRKLLDNAE